MLYIWHWVVCSFYVQNLSKIKIIKLVFTNKTVTVWKSIDNKLKKVSPICTPILRVNLWGNLAKLSESNCSQIITNGMQTNKKKVFTSSNIATLT